MIALKWLLMIQRFYQFVQIKIAHLRLLHSLGQSIILEVSNALKEGYLNEIFFTPLLLFLLERLFSTITRFFPGEIRDAFQNYVPRSMPMT